MAPHTGAHVASWPPCHLARLLRGPHASCHVALAPRRNGAVDPRATSAPRGPTRHVSRRSPRQHQVISPPFFAILTKKFLKKSIKNQIKIGKNSIKIQKFIFLKMQLLFNPNFLHWITNSFLFNIMSFKICFQEGK